MKQLTCEMCGSNDLVKTDNVFVCQMCGTKYSVEEAKKMMVEGTVKLDTSDRLDNLYKVARRAKEENNNETAAKYYDMILVDDPTSWEASFFSVYFNSMGCVIAHIQSAAIALDNCTKNVFELIRDYVPEEKQLDAVKEVVTYCCIGAEALFNGAKNHYEGIEYSIKRNYTQEFINRAIAARDICYNCGNNIDLIFGDKPEILKLSGVAWDKGISLHKTLMQYCSNKAGEQSIITLYFEKIKRTNPQIAKEELKKEISDLESTISHELQPTKLGCFGGFFLFVSIFSIIVGLIISSLGEEYGPVFIILGIIFLIIIIFIRNGLKNNDKNSAEKNSEILQKKKAELEALMKE